MVGHRTIVYEEVAGIARWINRQLKVKNPEFWALEMWRTRLRLRKLNELIDLFTGPQNCQSFAAPSR